MHKQMAGALLMMLCLALAGCANVPNNGTSISDSFPVFRFVNAKEASQRLSVILAEAKPGETIAIAGGTYAMSHPITLAAKSPRRITITSRGPGPVILDFSAEPEAKGQTGINISGDRYWLDGIEVTHAGSFGFYITGGHNSLIHCAAHENRNSGFHLDVGANHNRLWYCDSYRNFDPKTLGEDADGFAVKHGIGVGNMLQHCRSYQNADDGFDFWMSPNPILIEDCISYRNGYNIFHCPDFQGDGNGFKFGGNYVATAHIARRCISIENPLNGFDQNHNIGPLTLEDCTAIRCGKGFSFPEVPRSGQVVLRRNTSFGCQNILEPHIISEDNHWYADIPIGNLGPPPRPGHRDIPGAGEVPTTQETPLIVPADAPAWGGPADTPGTKPFAAP